MPALSDMPSKILASALIAEGIGYFPNTVKTRFTLTDSMMPGNKEANDRWITVTDTGADDEGRYMVGGDREAKDTVQIWVRAEDRSTAYLKARAVETYLNQVKNDAVVFNGHTYTFVSATITVHASFIGQDEINLRQNYSVNARLTITEV